MGKFCRLVGLFLPIIAILTVLNLSAAHAGEGDKPYVVTNMEWLLLDLERHHEPFIREVAEPSKILVIFSSNEPDTVSIQIYYPKAIKRSKLEFVANIAKKSVSVVTKNHGWTWVKTEEIRTPMK